MQRESLQSPARVSSSHATEEDAVRMASASLHSSIRNFRQTCLPLLAPQSKGLPVKHTVKVFVSRMTEEMTASALECLRVLPRDRVLFEKRRRDLLQWLSISPPSNNNGNNDATPLSLMFLNDLKERLTLHYAEAAGGAASRLTVEPTTETLTCVPAVVVLRVAEQLWAQRQTSTAERLLWKDGVEELLTVGGEQEETSGTLPAESFLRNCVVLSKTDEVPLGSSPTSTTSRSLLAAIVELWAWCKATDNINAEEEVESALQEQTTKSLLACWFPAQGAADDSWPQVMSRVMQRVSKKKVCCVIKNGRRTA
ncbi:Hypothetical protein, putative [Bodo saltans]|uniref:Uncharacterized protein n=1 Tax=Bodo saltans TaxID=75058 RepID=A0A0S4J272_BODSA|nr:Hypothetical protein, putative [Bodo saltans]|eukprot:CUG55117.1 Hypothetical protein, putative [Bodo saltans]